jgi:hypothetical protein
LLFLKKKEAMIGVDRADTSAVARSLMILDARYDFPTPGPL